MDIKLLKACNAYDRLLEKHRDDRLADLKAELYAGVYDDKEYSARRETIKAEYEPQFKRAWLQA